jgi:hypothetical protein
MIYPDRPLWRSGFLFGYGYHLIKIIFDFMDAQTIVAIALLIIPAGLVALLLLLIQEVQGQRSRSAPSVSRPRSPAPYRIQRLPTIEVVAKPPAKLPPGRPPSPAWRSDTTPFSATVRPQTTPSPPPRSSPRQSAAELKLIGLLHGNRDQAQRLIQSAGSADRALHQLLRDRQ